MADAVTCPGVDTLRRFLNGEVIASEAECIEGHLHTCRRCLDALGRLDDRDSLVEALRRSTPSPAPAAVIQRVVAQAEQLPNAGSLAAPDTGECRAEPTQSCPDVAPPIPPTAQTSSAPPDCPENLGRYRILGRLGSGGMGVVYLAEDPQFGRRVAIKVPRFGGSERNRLDGRRRFVREARTTAALRHPHICPVHDMGEHREQLYVVMAYVPGSSLAEFLLAQPRLPAGEAVRLALQIADALTAVHALGVVHRDLKPGNVLLDEHRQALLTDFGLAAGQEASDYPTLEGTILGTPWYMAPEQARGKPAEVDARCDLYGLGVILYQMLSGRLPFEGSQTAVLGLLVSGATPTPVEQHCPELDPVLAGIVNRAMARRPADRFADAAEMAEALRRWQPPAEAVLPPPARPAGPSRRLRTRLVAGAALLGVALFLALKYVIRSDAPRPLPGKTAGTAALRREALVSRPALLPGVLRWDIDTVGHRSPVAAVAYNRSGRWLATGGDDAVRVWDVRGGCTLARILPAGTAGKRFQGFAWGSREDELAVSWEGESLAVWNVAVGTRSNSLADAVGRVVNWSADGAVLLVVGTGGKPEWWDARAGKKLDALDRALAVVALSPDGARLAAASGTRLALYEVSNVGKPLWEDRVTANPEEVCWSPDGRRVAFAATGAKPRTWIVDAANRTAIGRAAASPSWPCRRSKSSDSSPAAGASAWAGRATAGCCSRGRTT